MIAAVVISLQGDDALAWLALPHLSIFHLPLLYVEVEIFFLPHVNIVFFRTAPGKVSYRESPLK